MDLSELAKLKADEIIQKIEKIAENKNQLKDALKSKGISIAENDKLPELVDKVELIKNNPYFAKGTTFKVSSSEVFLLENLNKKPKEFGFISETLINSKVYSSSDGYVIPTMAVSFPENEDKVSVSNCDVERVYDPERKMWSIKCSFEKVNKDNSSKLFFQGGFQYTWVTIYEV